jgi:hypothetical protein
VLEGRNAYRQRLASGNPATVGFRPVIGPLEPVPWPAMKPRDEAKRYTLAELPAEPPEPWLKPEPAAGPATIVAAEYHEPDQNAPMPRLKPLDSPGPNAEPPLPVPKPAPQS